jgi:hypothetical protein
VADHPRPFGEAVALLLADEGRRRELGDEARRRAAERFGAQPLTRRLEALYESVARDGRAPAEWEPDAATLAAFEAGYPERARRQLRPLTAREQVESRTAVLAERARWLARDAREDPVGRLRGIGGMLRARLRRAA